MKQRTLIELGLTTALILSSCNSTPEKKACPLPSFPNPDGGADIVPRWSPWLADTKISIISPDNTQYLFDKSDKNIFETIINPNNEVVIRNIKLSDNNVIMLRIPKVGDFFIEDCDNSTYMYVDPLSTDNNS